jgi:hypothetical protein
LYSSSTTAWSEACEAASPIAGEVTPLVSARATAADSPARLVVPIGWKALAISRMPRP